MFKIDRTILTSIKQLSHVKYMYNIKKQTIGRTDFLVRIIELLRFLHSTKLRQESSYRD